jgi:hypothetical protein
VEWTRAFKQIITSIRESIYLVSLVTFNVFTFPLFSIVLKYLGNSFKIAACLAFNEKHEKLYFFHIKESNDNPWYKA